MSLHDLDRIFSITPPVESRSKLGHNWTSINKRLGFRLPTDYMRLVDTYGAGQFDTYLWLLEPDCSEVNCDLFEAISEHEEALEYLWSEGEAPPPQLAASGGRMIPWGRTDNGEVLYWLTQLDIDSDDWTVMINEARGDAWEHYKMSCSTFLSQALSGTIKSNILWSRFPLVEHRFESVESFTPEHIE